MFCRVPFSGFRVIGYVLECFVSFMLLRVIKEVTGKVLFFFQGGFLFFVFSGEFLASY